MDLMKLAAQLFMQHSSAQGLNVDSVIGGLTQLLPTQGGQLDIAALVGLFAKNGGGLASMAQSWLANGNNDKLDVGDILKLLGDGSVANFASQLGMPKAAAADGLANMIPELIDNASENGSLVQDMGKKLAASALSRFF